MILVAEILECYKGLLYVLVAVGGSGNHPK
jgi:hypothetical protein